MQLFKDDFMKDVVKSSTCYKVHSFHSRKKTKF